MDAFCETYRYLHRRGNRLGPQITPQGRALILHLAWAGPLTISDLAKHSDRAQSVVSETVEVLVSHQLLEKVRDPRDRRKTLVWLTNAAQDYLAEEREPLDRNQLERAIHRFPGERMQAFLELYEAFLLEVKRQPNSETREQNQ
jgi:DNA-binding MarR family transcriptional regulator